jgi:hypothetical protein
MKLEYRDGNEIFQFKRMIDIVKKHLLVFVIEINKFEHRILSVENGKFWIWEAIFLLTFEYQKTFIIA